ncbi:MAG: NAD+ synthase [Gemmatimonadales bacterium]
MRSIAIALCQFRPAKGRPAENLDRIEQILRDVGSRPDCPDVLVFPEAITTGYFLEGGVRDHAMAADALFEELRRRHAAAGAPPLELCLGFYEIWDERIHNAALWVSLGGDDAGIRHVHRKVFLPTYGVFDEERFVEAGRDIRAFETRIGRVAMLVCEDAWHAMSATVAAVDGAQLIAVLSASPARGLVPDPTHPGQPGSLARWERLAREIAGEHGVFVAMAQLVGFEGGKGFPGGSLLVAPDGEVLARAPLFEDAILDGVIDLETIPRVRADSPLLADLELRLPHLIDALGRARTRAVARGEPAPAPEPRPLRRASAAAPAAEPRLAIDPALTRRWLVEFLRDEVGRRRGFERVILGVSGGVDSAVVAWLAAEALGPDRVIGVRMPYRTSSPASLEHARLVTAALGIEEVTVDITAAVDGYAAACGLPPTPARLGNVMARLRMTTLFDLSAARGALPLGTGNKSERLLGYFTWHADDSPPINPIGDLFKTQVWALARHLGVPEAIVTKPASADLIADQTDEADFGISYARADGILDLILRGFTDEAIAASRFTAAEVATVRGRLDATHWKRRLPSTAMVSGTAIGEYYLRPVDY